MLTTAASNERVPFLRNRLLQILAAAYAVIWIVAAIEPHYRDDWLLENILVAVFLPILLLGYGRLQLSDLSYLMIAVFMAHHAVGAHYTYAEAPVGFWIKDLFGLERNHFDRWVHFLFGLLFAYPIAEVVARKAGVAPRWSLFFAQVSIIALSDLYEIAEWMVATTVSPEAGLAFLGTQGDVFDAQKDSGLAATGSAITLSTTALLRHVRHRSLLRSSDLLRPGTGG